MSDEPGGVPQIDFKNIFGLEDTSQTNISEVSFPSHVSGLESFSEFDQTFSTLNNENSPGQSLVGDGIKSRENDFSFGFRQHAAPKEKTNAPGLDHLKLNLAPLEAASLSSMSTDAIDLSNGVLDLKSPSTGSERVVSKFLSQEIGVHPPSAAAMGYQEENEESEEFSKSDKEKARSGGNAEERQENSPEPPHSRRSSLSILQEDFRDIRDPTSTQRFEEISVGFIDSPDYDMGFGTQQRPGLDGSSSDSDDGTTNFARSRIGTVQQPQLAALLDEREQGAEANLLEERQLAEGDDVFSRDGPGDGGGGGDGSSGHSDSDIDGDGGVAIRVRARRTQRNRVRATAAVQPLNQRNEELPERERPVGDSVPAINLPWRSQLSGGDVEDTNEESSRASNGATQRSDLLTPLDQLDLDSSQDSRLSARFFITSSTPGQAIRSNSTPQNNWMEDNATFRLSESTPVTPRNAETDTICGPSFNFDTPTSESSSVRRDVLGDDSEADKTLVGGASGCLSESKDKTQSIEIDLAAGSNQTTPNISPRMPSEFGSQSTLNPFRLQDNSTNPFASFSYSKNPFDFVDDTNNGAKAFDFSGFGEQGGSCFGESDFKLNSQDAEALFDDDEKSFQHSTTISKLANLTHESEWNFEDVNDRGEVRVSKYFNAMSEELGTFSLDRPDRPRPNFDDYKVVKTPPAIEHPAILFRGLSDESDMAAQKISFGGTSSLDLSTLPNKPFEAETLPSNFSSTQVLPKLSFDQNLIDLDGSRLDLQADVGSRSNSKIRGQEGDINIPRTNDEAENLLHEIGVGRVSLRGISGVNISNLAAKIAVATNSEPKFILKLLISLIDGEKQEMRDREVITKGSGELTRRQQVASVEIKGDAHPSQVTLAANSATYRLDEPMIPVSGISMPRKDIATMVADSKKHSSKAHETWPQKQPSAANSKDLSAMKLSDLDDTLTPVKAARSFQDEEKLTSVVSSQHRVPVQSSSRMGNNDTLSYEYRALQNSSQASRSTGLMASSSSIRTTPGIANKTSTAPTRPISSVTPLFAPSENRALYRDSGVQCYTRMSNEQKQPVERGDTFERALSRTSSRSVSTVDAAVQYEPPSLRHDTSRDIYELELQSVKTLVDTATRTSHASLTNMTSKQLNSTAIFGDESIDKAAKGIALSPVSSQMEFPNEGQHVEGWRPLALSQNRSQSGLLKNQPVKNTDQLGALPRTQMHAAKFLSISGEQIQNILPRISDIRDRESSATFYPLITANQTVLGRPSVVTAVSAQQQQHQYAPSQQHQIPSQQPYPSHDPNFAEYSSGKADTVSSEHPSDSVVRKKLSLPLIQVIVPTEVTFMDVQCVGVAMNQCVPIHNPSSRWIQCLIEVAFYSVNGAQVDASSSCVFTIQPKVFIAPHTTEDLKLTFYAEHAGIFMAKLNVIASPVVTDDSILSEDDLCPNIVHIEGIAELPNIEILHNNNESLDFGEMPGGINRSRALKLLNKGRAEVPLRLILAGNVSAWKCFQFVDSDMTPIGSTDLHKLSEPDDVIQPPSLNILLPGCHQMGKTFEPEVIWIQFNAPQLKEAGFDTKLGPPKDFMARVDIEIDSKGNGITVGSMLLKAIVGTARLHAPRSLQAISMSAPEGQRVSRGIPFRNAGNISLEIQLQVSSFTDLFSVVPDQVKLVPGQSAEVFVHFQSMSTVTIESFLLVSIHPDGPQYEVVLRGTAAAPKPVKEKEERPVLLCNKPVLCWAGIPIGRSINKINSVTIVAECFNHFGVQEHKKKDTIETEITEITISHLRQQRAFLRNNSLTQDLQMAISVEGNHSDFQVQNTFDFKEKSANSLEVTLKPQSEVPVHVLFVPSTFSMISSALVIRPADGGPKFKIPLHGYGGCSKLQLTNAQKVGDNYWIDAGEVLHGEQNIVKISLQNVGNRAAFVKIVCYTDVSKRKLYPCSHISIAPNDFILKEKCTKQLVIILQPTEKVLQDAMEKPCAAASLAIFSGDESVRQLYRKHKWNSADKRIEKEGPLQNMIFDSPFMDEDKVAHDIEYPDIPNWENFFITSVSRTVVSLITRPMTNDLPSTPSTDRPLGLDAKDLMVTQTPARTLPVDTPVPGLSRHSSETVSIHKNYKDAWAVSPEHIVLTTPNTVSDKSTARIQMINYSDTPLSFEFSWPAESLIITPSKDNIPPRSQLIVFVSTKPSFLTTGGELPWRGCIYVQCEGIQKCIRVQIREDLAMESSPSTGLPKRLAPLNPSDTPQQRKQPAKSKQLLLLEPSSVIFPVTVVNRFQESFVKIESNATATLKWVLSSIAPPYFKDMTEMGDIFRTTYTAFRFLRYSGTLQPKEANTIQVTFQPRDFGEYSQFWDLQVAVESTGETGKSRVELRGKGVLAETNLQQEEGKLIGRAHPILKPPSEAVTVDKSKNDTTQRKTEDIPANAKSDATRNRGIFVKDDIVTFKATPKGETSEMQFRLCNDTMELQKVRFSGLKPPFSIKHNKLAIKSKSFIRCPVYYSPTEPGSRSEGRLEISAVTGPARTSYVKVIGICNSKR